MAASFSPEGSHTRSFTVPRLQGRGLSKRTMGVHRGNEGTKKALRVHSMQSHCGVPWTTHALSCSTAEDRSTHLTALDGAEG